jgi:DNA-binding PadR family transcriptional regulator
LTDGRNLLRCIAMRTLTRGALKERRHHPHDHSHEHQGRLRHGDVRVALLLALKEGPTHGYELGQRLERASGGGWRPSPGSIYPTLQALADEELVTCEERDGKRVYALSRRGTSFLKERAERGEGDPWQSLGGKAGELKEAVIGLKMAAKQVGLAGSPEQRDKAIAIVVEARRQLYELLAKG